MLFLIGFLVGIIVCHIAHLIYRRYKIVERNPIVYSGTERRHRDRNSDEPPREVRR